MEKTLQDINESILKMGDSSKVSDGYHTFEELYNFRKVFNALLFNEWALRGTYPVVKSRKYSDGTPCFGGWFIIVVATLPSGQISSHYKEEDWDLFSCQEVALPSEYDGHTAQDVLMRLTNLLPADDSKPSLTRGQRVMNYSFNPGQREDIRIVKQAFAEAYDTMDKVMEPQMYSHSSIPPDRYEAYSDAVHLHHTAKQHLEAAQMFIVKAITR